MRKRILAAALIAAAITRPAMANDLLRAYARALPASEVCLLLKYNVDNEGFQTRVATYAQQVANRHPAEAKADMAILHATADSFQADVARLRANMSDAAGKLAALDHVFQKYNPQCQALTRNPSFSAYFRPSRFSRSGQPQTTLNWLTYYANAGELLPMKMMAMMALKGIGVPKDRIAAAKWCYLVRVLHPEGADSVAGYESELTPSERAAGQKLGDAWIDTHR